MLRVLLAAGLCLLYVSSTTSKRLVCYYNREAATRAAAGAFRPSNIDPTLCTHIIFAFAHIDNNNNVIPFAAADTTLYTELNNLKNRNTELKTLIAVGGPGFNTQKFSSMVASNQNRAKFIASAVTFLQSNGFDGLNLDWRYPGDTSSQPKDKTRFTELCQELKLEFGKQTPALILSASVSAEKTMIDNSYEAEAVAWAVDFLNVLTFDFHTTTTATATAHHSPLGPLASNRADTLTTEYGMNHWRSLGAPAAKLNMGIAAFGVAFTLTNPATDSGVGAAVSGPAEEGCYGGVAGIWSYYETCLYTEGVTEQWISAQSVPYAVTEGQWVGYDNTASLDAKVSNITSNGYGGACVWALDLDDYTGDFCGKGPNPFISHLSGLNPGSTADNICYGLSGVFANPEDNKTYYNCDHGIATLQPCSPGLVFKSSCTCCDFP